MRNNILLPSVILLRTVHPTIKNTVKDIYLITQIILSDNIDSPIPYFSIISFIFFIKGSYFRFFRLECRRLNSKIESGTKTVLG